MAPGGSVVACVSSDSPVASFPFRISRICAPLAALFAVSDSNGKPPEGSELSCSPASAIGAAAPESASPGSSKHISRRVIVIVPSSFEVPRQRPKESFSITPFVKRESPNEEWNKTARSRSKQHAVQSLQYD